MIQRRLRLLNIASSRNLSGVAFMIRCAREPAISKRNTVHLMFLIAFRRLIGGSGFAWRGRRGKLLILRFTPRKFRRLWLDTTRSCRISSRTALWKAFLC